MMIREGRGGLRGDELGDHVRVDEVEVRGGEVQSIVALLPTSIAS